MISCGYNHSMAVTTEGELYAWGVSRNNELGFVPHSGHFQATPYAVELNIEGTKYNAYKVSCGAAHTAVVLKEEGTEKLRLLYSPNFDMTEVMNRLKNRLKITLENYRTTELGKDVWHLEERHVHGFLKKYLDPEDRQHLPEITRLFMSKAKGQKLAFKEFRDQIHGMRLGEGLVATWGLETNGRLGRPNRSSRSDGAASLFVHIGDEVVIRKVSCGDTHTLALGQGKQLYAWGGNQYGQLGNGTTNESVKPVQIRLPDNVDIIDIAAGGMHSMCATSAKLAYSWGYGEGGRLGHGESQLELSPCRIENLEEVIAVAAGHSHSGFICTDKVYTCGKGLFARLGHGTLNDEYIPRSLEFFQGKSLIKLSLSFFNSAGLTLNGEAYAWGDSKYGRCGTGISDGENILLPRRIGAGTMLAALKITDIALGLNHGLCVTVDGAMYAWGDATDGKLGLIDHKENEPLPKRIAAPDLRTEIDEDDAKTKRPVNSTRIVGAAANDFCTAIVTDAGEIKIWGNNSEGQLGLGDEGEMSSDESILADEQEEESGRPGAIGEQKDVYEPVNIPFFKHSKTLKVSRVYGAGNHFFVVTFNGLVYSWGSNHYGQLGLDSDSKIISLPSLLKSFRMMKVRRIATSPKHTAFVMDSGETFMCGSVNNGKLGLGVSLLEGETKSVYIPRQLRSIVNVDRVACGSDHTLVYSMAGKLYSWGSGYLGCLGNGKSQDVFEPEQVMLDKFEPSLMGYGIKDIACGDFHSLVVTTDGVVFGCGLPQYAGISGRKGAIFNFTMLQGFRQKISKIFSGREHSIATTVSGQIYAWGKNIKGRLGGEIENPHPEDETCLLPSMIFIDIIATKASCGAAHSCALSKTGDIYLWGMSANGRLGLGYDPEDIRQEVVKQPEINAKIQIWLNKSKEIESRTEKRTVTEPNNLQKLIKNEPNNCAEDELMSDGVNLMTLLIKILDQLSAFKQLEKEKIKEMNAIETLLVSGIPLLPSRVPTPKFFISMPVLISRNIQLFELMVALLQHHPCYITSIIKDNAQLSPSEACAHIAHFFGDITDNSRLMKVMMSLLFSLSLEIMSNLSEEQVMNERSGTLIDGIKSIIMSSQMRNTRFFSILSTLIIKKTVEIVLDSPEFKPDFLSEYNVEEVAAMDMTQENIKAAFQIRRERLITIIEPVKKLIVDALILSPTVRGEFKGLTLTQELKFMYKEISRIIYERFKYLAREKLDTLMQKKVYQMFVSPVVDYLSDIGELSFNIKQELEAKMQEFGHMEQLADPFLLDSMDRQMRVLFKQVGRFLDHLGSEYEENQKFFAEVYTELLKVPDFRLSDLLLKDFILHSTETRDPILTIAVGDLLQLYQLLFTNRWRLIEKFHEADPLLQISDALGDILPTIDALRKTEVFGQKVNLRLPSRWLLREQALQMCPKCTMPLTFSMLREHDMIEGVAPDMPISVPNKWRCKSCGTSQEGWSGRCAVCKDPRDEYPKSALFKTYISSGRNQKVLAFTALLRMMPEIPDHIPLITFIEKMQGESKSQIAAKIQELEALARRGTSITGDGIQALKKGISVISQETREAFEVRAAHRGYLDSIFTLLNSVSASIKQGLMQTNILIHTDFQKVKTAIQQGNSMRILKPAFTLSPRSMAYGEFSLYRMIQDGTLKNQEIPMQQRKKTTVSFSELEDGTFEVKFLFIESGSAIKLSRDDLVVQLYNFKITPERQNIMRRTMHYQAETAFEDGLLIFDVQKLIHLINRLV